ncbi:protein suppressor of hairy wing-like [Aricia agestis]|uniref:protein suppressor of hairy wing-like n=1 Tax=Aricia agestis TaxID=91739 RepID=UPI001C207CBB|nr:protein suppressor of hairy wing-like [Aricia agestis]
MFRSSSDVTENFFSMKHNEEEENERVQCRFCSRVFSETEMLLHLGVKHAKKMMKLALKDPFSCGICVKDCEDSNSLLEHIKVEHLFTSADSFRVQREIFICHECGTIFFNKKFIELHFETHIHKLDKFRKTLQCLVCPKKVCVKSMWVHLQGHDIQNVGMCPICFVKCSSRKLLIEHMRTHPRYLKCNMCTYEAKREDFFRQHVIDRHKTNATSMIDAECEQYFTPYYIAPRVYQKLGSHGVALTNDIRVCILCREICVGQSNMKQHIYVEHNLKTAEVKAKHLCTCGEIFTNKVLLKHHTFKLKGDHKMLE